MEESGIIKKYTIETAVEPQPNPIVFFTLMSNVKISGDPFFKYMDDISEVTSIDVITGKSNYLVKAEVNTTAEMQQVLKNLMKISTIESFISLNHKKIDNR